MLVDMWTTTTTTMMTMDPPFDCTNNLTTTTIKHRCCVCVCCWYRFIFFLVQLLFTYIILVHTIYVSGGPEETIFMYDAYVLLVVRNVCDVREFSQSKRKY